MRARRLVHGVHVREFFNIAHVHTPIQSLVHEFRAPPCISMIRVHGSVPISIRVWSALGDKVEQSP